MTAHFGLCACLAPRLRTYRKRCEPSLSTIVRAFIVVKTIAAKAALADPDAYVSARKIAHTLDHCSTFGTISECNHQSIHSQAKTSAV
jgi:hypothetical protein